MNAGQPDNQCIVRIYNPEEVPEPQRRKGRKLPTFLRDAQIAELLCALDEKLAWCRTPRQRKRWQRNSVMIHIGLLMGPRVSELCGIDLRDVDLPGATLLIRQGKGGVDRWLPIAARVVAALRAWIGDRTEGPLFPGRTKGKSTTRFNFNYTLRLLAKLAGIKKLHPHVLRHTTATRLLDKGANIAEVRDILGHASVATTNVYLHCQPGRLREAIDRL